MHAAMDRYSRILPENIVALKQRIVDAVGEGNWAKARAIHVELRIEVDKLHKADREARELWEEIHPGQEYPS